MQLEHVFDYEVALKPPVPIGAGPYGLRMFYEVAGGEVRGPKLSGKALSGGGDWVLIGEDGFARLDVRGQIETEDGATVYVTYRGVMELDGDYFRIAPQFETGDERYRWLTQSVFVARGRTQPGPGVAYEVFRVT
jgi:hypothetical protein